MLRKTIRDLMKINALTNCGQIRIPTTLLTEQFLFWKRRTTQIDHSAKRSLPMEETDYMPITSDGVDSEEEIDFNLEGVVF